MCLEYDHIDQEFLLGRETEKTILHFYFSHIMNDGPCVFLFDFGNNFKNGQEYAHLKKSIESNINCHTNCHANPQHKGSFSHVHVSHFFLCQDVIGGNCKMCLGNY